MIENQREKASSHATNSGPKPGDFPLGSPESRAAARRIAGLRQERGPSHVTITTGLRVPAEFESRPVVITPPDWVEY